MILNVEELTIVNNLKAFSPHIYCFIYFIELETIQKKYVIAETLDDFDLEPGESIQMIVGSPGSQLFEVEDEFSQRALASLPQKFRKTIWLKRKDFVVCMPIFEGNKVKYEITRYERYLSKLSLKNQ